VFHSMQAQNPSLYTAYVKEAKCTIVFSSCSKGASYHVSLFFFD